MSKIEWTDETWNPTRGCSRVSTGCENCYAERMAHRSNRPGGAYEGLTTSLTMGLPVNQRRVIASHGAARVRWTGKIRLVSEKLDEPLHWRNPRMVFVDSMSDLFHEDVPDGFVDQVFTSMALARQHTFQLLTKRAKRMHEYMPTEKRWNRLVYEYACWALARAKVPAGKPEEHIPWPLPNVWLGVSCENQKAADERIPWLLQTPATVRFVSLEPLLAPIDLRPHLDCSGWVKYFTDEANHPDWPEWDVKRVPLLHWVIVGGESGPGARPCDIAWVRDVVRQCRRAKVPVFVKQLGANVEAEHVDHSGPCPACLSDRKGADPFEWPKDLRVREWPR